MGICPSITKRYEGVGGLRQCYVTSFFKLTLLDLPSCHRVRRGFQNTFASISKYMFQSIMLTAKTGSHINNYP